MAAICAGRWILTGGLGGMGGAQPLAATMAGASMLAVECDPSRIKMRLGTRYLDRQAATLDEALGIIELAHAKRTQAVSVGPARQRRGRLSRTGATRRRRATATRGPISLPTRRARTIR